MVKQGLGKITEIQNFLGSYKGQEDVEGYDPLRLQHVLKKRNICICCVSYIFRFLVEPIHKSKFSFKYLLGISNVVFFLVMFFFFSIESMASGGSKELNIHSCLLGYVWDNPLGCLESNVCYFVIRHTQVVFICTLGPLILCFQHRM